MTWFDFPKLGNFFRAPVYRQGTPGMEDASARRIYWAWYLPFYDFVRSFGFHCRVRYGNRSKQGSSVGVNGVVVKLVTIGQLDNFAQIHDRDPVAEMPNHA